MEFVYVQSSKYINLDVPRRLDMEAYSNADFNHEIELPISTSIGGTHTYALAETTISMAIERYRMYWAEVDATKLEAIPTEYVLSDAIEALDQTRRILEVYLHNNDTVIGTAANVAILRPSQI